MHACMHDRSTIQNERWGLLSGPNIIYTYRVAKPPVVHINCIRPGEKLVMDFTGFGAEDAPPYHRYLLLCVDHFTKYIWGATFPTKEAGPVAQWLYTTIYANEFIPETVLSDNGGEFINEVLNYIHTTYQVRDSHSRPHAPSADARPGGAHESDD